jgi:hypothetical protein
MSENHRHHVRSSRHFHEGVEIGRASSPDEAGRLWEKMSHSIFQPQPNAKSREAELAAWRHSVDQVFNGIEYGIHHPDRHKI